MAFVTCFALACGHAFAEDKAANGEPGQDRATTVDLASIPIDPRVKGIEPWLRNSDASVRSIAAFDLRRRSETGVVRLLTQMLHRETNVPAIACALRSLTSRTRHDLVAEGGTVLVDALLPLLDHAHPTVRERAVAVIQRIPHMALGSDPSIYKPWWTRHRGAIEKEHARLAAALKPPPKKASVKGGANSVEAAPDNHLYESLERMRRHGLEVCIVMDHTSSMLPVIGATKRQARSLVNRLQRYLPAFRAALVTYDDRAMARCTLTTSSKLLVRAFNRVAAAGGADWEEGVDKGIALALKQSVTGWSRRALRMIVVMGDAPPHSGDIPTLMRILRRARSSLDYDVPIQVHTVSAGTDRVHAFPEIARAGGGLHVQLGRAGNLAELFVRMAMGGARHETVLQWMNELDEFEKAERAANRKVGRKARR